MATLNPTGQQLRQYTQQLRDLARDPRPTLPATDSLDFVRTLHGEWITEARSAVEEKGLTEFLGSGELLTVLNSDKTSNTVLGQCLSALSAISHRLGAVQHPEFAKYSHLAHAAIGEREPAPGVSGQPRHVQWEDAAERDRVLHSVLSAHSGAEIESSPHTAAEAQSYTNPYATLSHLKEVSSHVVKQQTAAKFPAAGVLIAVYGGVLSEVERNSEDMRDTQRSQLLMRVEPPLFELLQSLPYASSLRKELAMVHTQLSRHNPHLYGSELQTIGHKLAPRDRLGRGARAARQLLNEAEQRARSAFLTPAQRTAAAVAEQKPPQYTPEQVARHTTAARRPSTQPRRPSSPPPSAAARAAAADSVRTNVSGSTLTLARDSRELVFRFSDAPPAIADAQRERERAVNEGYPQEKLYTALMEKLRETYGPRRGLVLEQNWETHIAPLVTAQMERLDRARREPNMKKRNPERYAERVHNFASDLSFLLENAPEKLLESLVDTADHSKQDVRTLQESVYEVLSGFDEVAEKLEEGTRSVQRTAWQRKSPRLLEQFHDLGHLLNLSRRNLDPLPDTVRSAPVRHVSDTTRRAAREHGVELKRRVSARAPVRRVAELNVEQSRLLAQRVHAPSASSEERQECLEELTELTRPYMRTVVVDQCVRDEWTTPHHVDTAVKVADKVLRLASERELQMSSNPPRRFEQRTLQLFRRLWEESSNMAQSVADNPAERERLLERFPQHTPDEVLEMSPLEAMQERLDTELMREEARRDAAPAPAQKRSALPDASGPPTASGKQSSPPPMRGRKPTL